MAQPLMVFETDAKQSYSEESRSFYQEKMKLRVKDATALLQKVPWAGFAELPFLMLSSCYCLLFVMTQQ
eukprot:9487241-Pyramimonas_sp.AAC.1